MSDPNKFMDTYRIATTRVDWSTYGGGVYFITFCTDQGHHYLGEIRDNKMYFTNIGEYTQKIINETPIHYQYCEIPFYVVMPNHVHLYLYINREHPTYPPDGDRNPLVAYIVGSIKSAVTRYANHHQIPFKWQSRFHDHIIRDYPESEKIRNYILSNVEHWLDDCYHR